VISRSPGFFLFTDKYLPRVSLEKQTNPINAPEGLSVFIWKVFTVLIKPIINKSQPKKEEPTDLFIYLEFTRI
jgi:hypothetical protein